jgi:hypothetical protein
MLAAEEAELDPLPVPEVEVAVSMEAAVDTLVVQVTRERQAPVLAAEEGGPMVQAQPAVRES